MYAVNQTNSLYFYPHKLSFAPFLKTAERDQHNRWLLGYTVSVSSPRAQSQRECGPPMLTADPSGPLDRGNQDIEADRMDDDGARHLKTEPSDR
jgi:hypothetical protein